MMEVAADRNRSVRNWLFLGCFMVAAMVVIGGITRLTHSGLSMVEWKLIMGAVPPLSEQAWQDTFEKYKQFPEYREVNSGMTLSAFKSIFFWEYLHRLWGRLIGLVFFIPFVFFIMRGKIRGELLKKCLLIFAGGAFVGGLGWFMVLSGLKDIPDVSHYRLALHLTAAFLLFGWILHTALGLSRVAKTVNAQIKRQVGTLLGLIVMQVIFGAFVAGLEAGKWYNTFPKMGDYWVPDNLVASWAGLTSSVVGVQFIHRTLAFLILLQVVRVLIHTRRKSLPGDCQRIAWLCFAAVGLQFLLGVFTLLFAVPISLGVLHQFGALIVFATCITYYYKLRKTT